jgi:hypothetical protein
MSFSAVAGAGGRRGSTGMSYVPSRPFVNFYVNPQWSTRAQPVPIYPYQFWYTIPETPPAPPPPPPQPQVVYIEREREPAPQPQVIVIETPAPQVVVEAPAPAPVVAAPAPVAAPPAPIGPRTPGPDVFQWTDDDGVVHYSTRQPANGKGKKLAPLAK